MPQMLTGVRIAAERGTVMSDADWVEDVRRWYFSGRGANTTATATAPADGKAPAGVDADDALGYEAADPVLQARHWPDAALVSTAPTTAR